MSSGDGLDTLLDEVGMGRFQVLGLVANFLIWTVLSPHTIGTTLLNAPVPFHCATAPHHNLTEKSLQNGTEYEILNAELDEMERVVISPYDNRCLEEHLLNVGKSGDVVKPFEGNISAFGESIVEPILESCPYIHYDNSLFSSTVTTEWHLICERSPLRSLFQNAYTIGLIVGCFIGGDVGDRLGRARAVLVGSIIHAVSTIVVAFTTNFVVLLLGRFVVGLTNLMILVPVVTLSMETCPQKFRGPIGMLVGMPYSLGVVVFAGLGIFIRDWRNLYIATSFPALLLLPVAWFLDESPRWLLQMGRLDEANDIIKKAARINRHKFDSEEKVYDVLKEVLKRESKAIEVEKKEESLVKRAKDMIMSVFNILKTPAMRKISIISPTVWFLNEVVYYGTIFNANRFASDNPFLYIALTGVADGLAIALGTVGTYFTRKWTVAGSQFVSGSLLLLVLAIPDEMKWLQWLFVMVGFLMCACASQALFVYTPELFPTTVRARGFAFSNLTGYTGTLVAPFIPDMLAQYGWWITNTILGSIGFISGSMISTLIETNHLPMCETVQDIENREKAFRLRESEKTSSEKMAKANELQLTSMSQGITNLAMEKEE